MRTFSDKQQSSKAANIGLRDAGQLPLSNLLAAITLDSTVASTSYIAETPNQLKKLELAMTVEHRVILKRTSSAVRPHPRGPAPESLAVSRSRSPARRHSKPPDSGRTRCTAAAGEPGVLGGGGSPLLKPMDPHVRRRRRFLASTVLTFLVTLWMVNAHSFLTDTTGRFRSSVGSAAGNRPGNDGRMLRGEYESKAGAGAVAATTTAAAALDDPALTAGKEPILQLLRDAGVTNQLDTDTLAALPTWQQVTDLYGSQPVLHGLDTCPTFRASSDPAEHLLGVAGTFNTGTNLLAELLIQNCEMPARMAKYGAVNKGIRWQVRKFFAVRGFWVLRCCSKEASTHK